ncbi:MAG: ATP-binding protein [Ignavibacteriales bacterium]|nr:ATP-binding protein [Ignavibacteriales bacterium]MCF8305411.1 ATP-binding protein [Ignavibacteriales bacterium]MCF8316094.1 ATP-binding protein [Ignavibacteriales bacterium]MCF8436596.1 ATP-binding protein [Ignavibacteriales bacterium]
MIEDVIYQQKSERDRFISSEYIPRDAQLDLHSGFINVIIGPRRAGKSFFALHSLADKKFGYANFDDERLIKTENYDQIIRAIDRLYARPDILLFDEIQNLQDWELFVNRLQRQGRIVVITGSNSNLLSGELLTHLTGRNYPVYIFPFSYRELSKSVIKNTIEERRILLHEMLENSGYPEVVIKRSDSREYLRMILRDTIYKDIIARYKPRDPVMVNKIVDMLINGIGSHYSLRNISDITGYNERTVSKYVSYILNIMIFFQIPRFSYKVREQHRSLKKIYAIDNGIINSGGFNPSVNRKKKLENLVASELYKRSLKLGDQLFYWKRDYECDFVIQKANKITEIVQVSADVRNPKTLSREMRAITEASSFTNCEELTIVTIDDSSIRQFEWYGKKKEIRLVPFTEWVDKLD